VIVLKVSTPYQDGWQDYSDVASLAYNEWAAVTSLTRRGMNRCASGGQPLGSVAGTQGWKLPSCVRTKDAVPARSTGFLADDWPEPTRN